MPRHVPRLLLFYLDVPGYQRRALRSSGTGSIRVQVRGPYEFRYGSVSVGRYGFVRGVCGVCTGSVPGPGGFEFGSAQRTENPASQVGSYWRTAGVRSGTATS